MSAMVRCRIFVGLTSAAQGAGGVLFDNPVGLSALVHWYTHGWLWSALLIGAGVLMALVALSEIFGRRAWGAFPSAFILGSVWIGVAMNSGRDGMDTVVLLAPIYTAWCGWTSFEIAKGNRHRAIGARTGGAA